MQVRSRGVARGAVCRGAGRAARLLPLLLLAVLLAGCRLDADVLVTLDADGGGTFSVQLTIDRELAARADEAGVDPLGDAREALRDADGWQVRETRHDDGDRSLTLRARFADPEVFAELTAQFAQAVSGPELAPLGPWTLTVDDERVRVEGEASLRPSGDDAVFGMTAEQAQAALASSVVYAVRVRLPGEILDTNADRLDGELLRWSVPAGAQVRVVAEGQRPPRSVWPLLLGGVAAGALTALWLRRRADRTAG